MPQLNQIQCSSVIKIEIKRRTSTWVIAPKKKVQRVESSPDG